MTHDLVELLAMLELAGKTRRGKRTRELHTRRADDVLGHHDLRCIFTTFLHRNIGLRRRRHQLVPVKDILHNPRYLRLGFNRITFFKK